MNNKHIKGFSLVELIVALTVFVVGIVSLYPFFAGGVRMIADIDRQIVVANLARSKMAEIETAGFIDSPSDTPRTAFNAPYTDYDYAVTWTALATDVASSSDVILYQAQLTIFWQSRNGPKQDRFVTYLSRMNPY